MLVTDGGGHGGAEGGRDGDVIAAPPCPPEVEVKRVTGAGDTFMAAHIAAEIRGKSAPQALEIALETAARYVSGEDA